MGGSRGGWQSGSQPPLVEDCTACEDRSRCHETFTCETCGRTLNCCFALPGWPTAPLSECVECRDERELPPGWDSELDKVRSKIRSAERQRQRKAALRLNDAAFEGES